jgi:hypothetical protein
MKTLVFIIGPPAVGKMTVGAALRDLTGLPLFHNHQSIEAVLPVFGFGTPQFGTLVGEFRRRVFEEVANSDLPGLIFTFVWAFDVPADMSFVEELKAIFESRGGRTVFVELWADLETRLGRNASELRLAEKPSKRNVAQSRSKLLEHEARYRFSSDGDFPFAAHLRIDNSDLQPSDAAGVIANHFDLPRVLRAEAASSRPLQRVARCRGRALVAGRGGRSRR